MRETFDFLRSIYEPPKNNLIIPLAETIPDRIATPHHKPINLVLSVDPPDLDLSANEEMDMIECIQEQHPENKDPTLKEVIVQAKSEMNKPTGEKFTKAKHREDVLKKHYEQERH